MRPLTQPAQVMDIRDAIELYRQRNRQLDLICRRAVAVAGRLRDIVEVAVSAPVEPPMLTENKPDESNSP